MDDREQKAFDAIPPVPEGSTFVLQRVVTHTTPHPYCIGPGHVGVAADEFGGILGEAALDEAERQGIYCQMVVRGSYGKCGLPRHEHKTELSLLIETPVKLEKNLKEVPGLHEYLMSIKDVAEAAGITGFGFPHRK
jgi:hypothetical protein